MSGLNQNQVRRLLATFGHVDSLLRDIERVSHEDLSPFAQERADLAPDEARLLRSFVTLARQRMLAALDRLGIPRPAPSSSARWSVGVALAFADISLSEINEASLRGYGEVDPATAAEIAALIADLRALLERGKALLHEHDPGGLAERLAAVPGTAGEVLRTLERISAEHGFAELRPLISAAAESILSSTFDVGIFGRVSAGKSSLVNALVGQPVLPVGVTPVTAVPIRIAHGPPSATVTGVDGRVQPIDLADLQEYATEQRNPRNVKGVQAIEVRVPGVPPALRLLDTPGVGSLASSGPAQAFAWLPRCQLGLVLIAVGTAVGHDDLALVTGLVRAGISCTVLLSKADLLTPSEVDRTLAYVKGELDSALGAGHGVEVRAVSTLAGHDASLAQLRSGVLTALAADHDAMAKQALKVRLHRLVAAAAAALNGSRSGATPRLEIYRARAAAAEVIRRETDQLASATQRIIMEAAEALLRAWTEDEDPAQAVRRSILDSGARALAAIRAAIDEVRRSSGEEASMEERRLPPLFDPAFLGTLPPLAPPPIARHLLGRRRALARLESLSLPLREALSLYAARLYAWGMAQVEEIGEPDIAVELADRPTSAELARLDAMIDAL